MLSRIFCALLLVAAPSIALAQSRGSPRYDAITVDGSAMLGSVVTPSLLLGGSALTGVGTTSGTLAAGNDSRVVGATQNASAAITGGTINGAVIGGASPAAATFTALAANGLTLSTPLPLAQGGCGATSALGCLNNLGIAGGTAGYVLTSNGPGTAPTYQPATGGGTTGAVRNDIAQNPTPAQIAQALANVGALLRPQGRLTLSSGAPTLTSTVAAAGTIYYTPSEGDLALVGTGLTTAPTPVVFSEVSQALSDATKSPNAAVASTVYDLFAWMDGSTFRVTRGPAWSAGASTGSSTTRGSGAGSTALARAGGVLVNAVSITNGPAAGYGVYVGTIATDSGGATVTVNRGSLAAGGGPATVGLWNAYNRVAISGSVQDSTANWTYSGGWRAVNGSTNERVTFVSGLAVEPWTATYAALGLGNNSGYTSTGLGLNTTTAFTGTTGYIGLATQNNALANASVQVLGQNYLQAIEFTSAGTATFYGSLTGLQSGLNWQGFY